MNFALISWWSTFLRCNSLVKASLKLVCKADYDDFQIPYNRSVSHSYCASCTTVACNLYQSALCFISQEEALLVETAMQNKMREALEELREAADTLLEQTVKQVSCC